MSNDLNTRFGGWSGWPVTSGGDLHDYGTMIQLWLAIYERCLALGGTNDFPRRTSEIIDGVTFHISDDVPYIDDGSGGTVMPLKGDDAHPYWTGPRCYGHEASDGGGDYPGVPSGPCLEWDNQYWYNETEGGDYVTIRWEPNAWKCLRMLQKWLLDNCVNFVEWKPKSNGSTMGGNGYDEWTDVDPVTGLATNLPPPNYTLEKWAAKASIPSDTFGNYFSREYPAEFRIKEPITGIVIPCGGEDPIEVTRPADTTYRDGTPIQAGDYARWVGNNVEDNDYDTGQWCGDGMGGSVWIPWPTLWVEGDGKVYRRNDSNTAWEEIEKPYSTKPKTISKYGLVERGDYFTVTVANEIFRGIDVLRWTLGSADFRNKTYDTDDIDDHGEYNQHAGASLQIYDPDHWTWSDGVDAADGNRCGDYPVGWDCLPDVQAEGGSPHQVARGEWSGDGLLIPKLDAAYFYGRAGSIPRGIPGSHSLSCDVDFMNWATLGVNNGGEFGDAGDTYLYNELEEVTRSSHVAWDDLDQEVYFRKWRVWDTIPGTEPIRWSEALGSNDKPPWCASPDIMSPPETQEYGDSQRGYKVAGITTIRRWDTGMTFAMPLSYWGS